MPDLTDAELLTLMRDADRIYGPHSEWYRALDELEALRAENTRLVASTQKEIDQAEGVSP